MLSELFVSYLEDSIRKNWTITSLSDFNGESFTFAEVAANMQHFHILFESLGIKKGDKISLVGKNSSRWCILYLAVVSYGSVVVPILPDFKPNDTEEIINHSDSVFLFSDDSIFETLDLKKLKAIQAVASINSFKSIDDGKVELAKKIEDAEKSFTLKFPSGLSPELFKFPKVANKELAVISYTSGTTGHSKGVMLAHNSLAANIRFAQNNMPLNPGDPILSFLPLAHAYGCAFEFLFPFTIGCHITLLTKTPSPQIIMQAFKEITPALILSVPLVIEKIFKKNLLPVISKPLMKILLAIPGINGILHKKIRAKLETIFGNNFTEIIIGGAAFNREAEIFFRKIGFAYTVGYGMTECGPLISYASSKVIPLGSSGKSVDTLEVKIDSPDPQNQVGEIMLRGENVMNGYYKNEEATNEILEKDGWLHTGDLGLIDKDGFIYIKGRSKSLILGASGKNIYPEELESMFNNKFGVVESVVVHRDEKLVALVFVDEELMAKNKIDQEHLIELLDEHRKEINSRVPAYMNVSKLELHPTEFVKTPKRSIKRFLYS